MKFFLWFNLLDDPIMWVCTKAGGIPNREGVGPKDLDGVLCVVEFCRSFYIRERDDISSFEL